MIFQTEHAQEVFSTMNFFFKRRGTHLKHNLMTFKYFRDKEQTLKPPLGEWGQDT